MEWQVDPPSFTYKAFQQTSLQSIFWIADVMTTKIFTDCNSNTLIYLCVCLRRIFSNEIPKACTLAFVLAGWDNKRGGYFYDAYRFNETWYDNGRIWCLPVVVCKCLIIWVTKWSKNIFIQRLCGVICTVWKWQGLYLCNNSLKLLTVTEHRL